VVFSMRPHDTTNVRILLSDTTQTINPVPAGLSWPKQTRAVEFLLTFNTQSYGSQLRELSGGITQPSNGRSYYNGNVAASAITPSAFTQGQWSHFWISWRKTDSTSLTVVKLGTVCELQSHDRRSLWRVDPRFLHDRDLEIGYCRLSHC
jgi:hypothetical protein